jgi:hypothetical protein
MTLKCSSSKTGANGLIADFITRPLVSAARNPRLFAAVPLWNENPTILNSSFRTAASAHGVMQTQA